MRVTQFLHNDCISTDEVTWHVAAVFVPAHARRRCSGDDAAQLDAVAFHEFDARWRYDGGGWD